MSMRPQELIATWRRRSIEMHRRIPQNHRDQGYRDGYADAMDDAAGGLEALLASYRERPQ